VKISGKGSVFKSVKKRWQLGVNGYFDEVFININGVQHCIGRFVDQDSVEINILFQKC
jgi:hypothetical protein